MPGSPGCRTTLLPVSVLMTFVATIISVPADSVAISLVDVMKGAFAS